MTSPHLKDLCTNQKPKDEIFVRAYAENAC